MDIWEAIKTNNIKELSSMNVKSFNEQRSNQKPMIIYAIEEQCSLETIKFLVEHGADLNETDKMQRNALHTAILNHVKIEVILYIIDKGVRIGANDNKNSTPLHYAILHLEGNERKKVTGLMIRKGVEVNAKNNQNETPLHLACQQNEIQVIRNLISHGAEVNVYNFIGETPLHLCFANQSLDMAKYLIQNGADLFAITTNQNRTCLHYACLESANLQTVKFLVDKRLDVRARDFMGLTPLHLVCKQPNSLDIAQFLLTNGADLEANSREKESTPLHLAIAQNSIKLVQYLIQKYPKTSQSHLKSIFFFACEIEASLSIVRLIERYVDINKTKGNKLSSILHTVCNVHQSREILDFLVERKADVNAIDSNRNTPLHISCEREMMDFIKILVENHADVNILNNNKDTPLHIACRKNSIEIAKYLLENGANPKQKLKDFSSPMDLALRNDSFELVKLLFEHGFNLNEPIMYDVLPLHHACQSNSMEIIKFMVEKGADVHKKCKGKPPLVYLCVTRGFAEILQFFVDKGVDINEEYRNTSFFEYALEESTVEVVKFFINKGYDVNKLLSGSTPLHIALKRDSLDIVKLLIEKGANVNEVLSNNDISLHYSARYNSFDILKTLVEHGADCNARNTNMETPFHLACQFKSLDTLKFLVDHGADIHATTNDNQTSLHFAMRRKQISFRIIGYLVKKGNDINLEDKSGQTPISLAFRKGHLQLIHFLLLNGANFLNIKSSRIQKKTAKFLGFIYSFIQDMSKLMNLSEFSDYEIPNRDAEPIPVHKTILLTRFDNDKDLLQKFTNVCQQKPKEIVQWCVNFLYTGSHNPALYFQKIHKASRTKKKEDVFIRYLFSTKERSEQEKVVNKIEEEKRSNQEEAIRLVFEEIGLNQNWIKLKSGRFGLTRDLRELYHDESTKDFTIICEDQRIIRVHKLILIMRSDLFKAMFQLNVQDTSNQVHDYSGKSFEALNELIYFFYNDEVDKSKITKQVLEELRNAEEFYQLHRRTYLKLVINDLSRTLK
eukprot:Anaeramoba_ignava/c21512_g8_i2.p1 GENE.c21512_g8_i2~~c21512_g8_i2.p1  ORF type:complete len:1015 (+),score=296.89 c21512_g8_i2:22-3066(+)